ncbi:MAG: hypothetical protein IKE18_02920 [Oscillospiraceae bacterium]|nr:hypothetical protein [Oscillospiraceae bacterium]
MMTQREKELSEAITASERVLDHLYAAETNLKTAKNWGVIDIVGGGFVSTFVKREYMETAQRELWAANSAIQVLNNEIDDVERVEHIDIDTSGLLAFADFFLDGLLADALVQAQINDVRNRVIDTINRIQDLRNYLIGLYNN